MDNFISNLKKTIQKAQRFSCFAIDLNKKVGMKIQLSQIQLKDYMEKTVHYLCKEKYSKMQIGEFPSASPKEFIEIIKCDDELIKENVNSILMIPSNVETNELNIDKYNAYMIILDTGDKKYNFITKIKPFFNYKKKFLYFLSNEDYKIIQDKLIKLIMNFDCIISNNKCYIINTNGKKILGLEDATIKESIENSQKLLDKHIIPLTQSHVYME